MHTRLKPYRSIIFLLLIVSVSFSTVSASSAPNLLKTTANFGNAPYSLFVPVLKVPNLSIFGASLHQPVPENEMSLVQSARLGWSRVGIEWRSIEPLKGVFDWSQAAAAEQAMISASQAGMQIVLLLEGTPSWAVKPGYTCGVIREDYFSEFSNFAKEVIRRYSVSPYNARILEIYNEPDAATFLGCWGDPGDTFSYGGAYYGKFLQSIYPSIKSFNSSIQVLVGGLLMDCNPVNPPAGKNCTSSRFFEGILSSGAGSSFDGVAFHSYDYYQGSGDYANPNWQSDRETTGSAAFAKSAYLRSVMANYGIAAKPLYNTEFAMFCAPEGNPAACDSFRSVLEATKAYYIVEFMASAMADGLNSAIWYAIMSGRDNSLLQQDFTPLPIFNAYQFANQEIGNARYSRRINDANFVIHELIKPSGSKLWIVWTRDNLAHLLTLPVSPKAIYRIGTDGNAISEAPSTMVSLDIAPVMIELNQ